MPSPAEEKPARFSVQRDLWDPGVRSPPTELVFSCIRLGMSSTSFTLGVKKRQQNIKVKSLFVSVSKGSWPQGSRTVVQQEEQRGVRDLSHSAGF